MIIVWFKALTIYKNREKNVGTIYGPIMNYSTTTWAKNVAVYVSHLLYS